MRLVTSADAQPAAQSYEDALGAALEELIAMKVDDLDGFASGLNERGLRAPAGRPGTADLLRDELARLGA